MTVGGAGGEGNARKFAAEVGGVALAVLGVVQDGVDVVEDVPLRDGGVVVLGAELFEGPVGDVLAAVGGGGGADTLRGAEAPLFHGCAGCRGIFHRFGGAMKGRSRSRATDRSVRPTWEFELRSNGQPGAAVPTCACLGLKPGSFF
ncbi:MAG: hypothetical protein WA437_13855 [Candidatus Sulfotelmatobacter sp.]